MTRVSISNPELLDPNVRRQQLLGLYKEMHEAAHAQDPELQPRQLHPRVLESEIVLVGQGLAKGTQRLSGFPYVKPGGALSPGGRELDRFLAKFGYTIDPTVSDRKYAHHMDLVMRFPGRRARGFGDIVPTGAEVEASWGWIERELEILSPRVIVALGAEAASRLLNKYSAVPISRATKLEALTMKRHLATLNGRSVPILAVYHPSGAFQFPSVAPGAYEWAAAETRAILEHRSN